MSGAVEYLFNNCGPGHGENCDFSFRSLLEDSPLASAWNSVFGSPKAPTSEVNTYFIGVGGTVAVFGGGSAQGGIAFTPGQDIALFGAYGLATGFDASLGYMAGYNKGPLSSFQGISTAVNAGFGLLSVGPGGSYTITDGNYTGAAVSFGFRGVPPIGPTLSVIPNTRTCTISVVGKTKAGC